MVVSEHVEAWEHMIRPMSDADVPFAAREHLECFPEGFFARLGSRFLRGYYRSFLGSEDACALVAHDGKQPVGYLVGMTLPAKHRDHVLRIHRARLAFLGGTALLARPKLLVEFLRLRARHYWLKVVTPVRLGTPDGIAGNAAEDSCACRDSECRLEAGVQDPRAQGSGSAVLAHVAVTTRFRERGIGEALVTEFLRHAGKAGCERVLLVTASEGRAARYYRRRRWTAVGERQTPDGRSLTEYAYPTLFPTPPPAPHDNRDR